MRYVLYFYRIQPCHIFLDLVTLERRYLKFFLITNQTHYLSKFILS